MTALRKLLIQQIKTTGPLSVSDYMSACLGHPKYGYYMTRDPFGTDGDFTTAPEISQMFGELIGLWLAQAWIDRGSPSSCQLIECGPGRGTLMADILRAAKMAPGFLESLSIHLVETSPTLTDTQKDSLKEYPVTWHKEFSSLPNPSSDIPNFIIGNEFFDALPIHQLVRISNSWHERLITSEGDDALIWAYDKNPSTLSNYISEIVTSSAQEGDIAECSPLSLTLSELMAERISISNGVGLFPDYGYSKPAVGDSLQALSDHQFCDVLNKCGNADLTAHVDFTALANKFDEKGCKAAPLLPQGLFLKRLGIDARADQLTANASKEQAINISASLKRLTHADEMGSLFKVLAIRAKDGPKLAAFEAE